MDRGRRVAGRSFKEELTFDAKELVEGQDNDDADEDYDVNSFLDMTPGDYEYGRRSVSVATPLSQDQGGSSSSTGWFPVPQHQFPLRITQSLSICQVENCIADMSNAKQYHKRHKVCEFHAKAQISIVAGLQQRFCQQCSRFHLVSEFDESKRSCRRRLAGHNQRRRKSSYDSG